MKIFLSIMAWGFTALTTFYIFLLSLREAEPVKASVLCKFIVPPPFGLYLVVFFMAIGVTSHILLHNLPAPRMFDTVKGPQDESLTKSNERSLEAEFEDAASAGKAYAKDYFQAGERDFEAGRYEDALKNYGKSLSKLETMSAYLNLSICLNNIARFTDAEQVAEKGLAIALKKGHELFQAVFLSNIANMYRRQGKLNQALEYLEQATLIFERKKDLGNWANTRATIGMVYLRTGRTNDALVELRKSLKVHKDLKDIDNVGHDQLTIGNIYLTQEKFKEALASYQEALASYRRKGTLSDQASALGNIGGAYAGQGDFDKALEFQQQALQLYRKMNDPVGVAKTIGNIGSIYLRQGHPIDALKQLSEALEIQKRIGVKSDQAITLHNIARTYEGMGQDEKALIYLRESLDLTVQVGAQGEQASVLLHLGELYFKQGDVHNALATQLHALEIATTLRDIELEKMALNNLVTIYSHMGNKKELTEVERRLATINVDGKRE